MRIMMATPFISPCIGEDERTPRQHLDAVDVHRPGVRPTNLTFIFIAALDVRRLTSFNNFESSVITCPFLKREYTCELTGLTPPVTRSSPGVTCNFTTHMAPVRLVCELTKGTPGGSVLPVHTSPLHAARRNMWPLVYAFDWHLRNRMHLWGDMQEAKRRAPFRAT